jgi:RHS repeat-associated protein
MDLKKIRGEVPHTCDGVQMVAWIYVQDLYGLNVTYGDSTQLIFLRARWYNPADGRFQSRDTWEGGYNHPLSLNKWIYTVDNPVNLTDPTGNFPEECRSMSTRRLYEDCVRNAYGLSVPSQHNIMPKSDLRENSSKYGSSGCWKGPVAYTAPGILLGESVTISAIGSVGVGIERVFDFANMTSQWFDITTYGLTDSVGFNGMGYYGVIFGLNNANTTDIVYGGESHFRSIGVATPGEIAEASTGWTISQSTTIPELITRSQYYSASAGVDFIPILEVSFGTSYAVPRGDPRGEDIGSMMRQVAGNFFNLSKFMNYAYIHEEIYADSQ